MKKTSQREGDRWLLGWSLGGTVVAVAAGLLLLITGWAKRIVRRADEIEAALDGAHANTKPIFDLTSTNLALDRIARGLRASEGP